MRFFQQNLSSIEKIKIGILGGGQLGWMMILEGRKYPFEFYILDVPEAPACSIADKCFKPDEYKDMIDLVTVTTYEFEHVYENALLYAEEKNILLPKLICVELKRERWREREFYRKHGIPTPRYFITQDPVETFRIARNEFNYKCVIKQSKGGYDGKGQFFIKNRNDLEKYIDIVTKINDVFIVEEYIDFDYEASVIAARDAKGNFKVYPPTYNYNEKGILIYNYGPILNKNMEVKINEIAKKLCELLNYVGVMGIEFFVKNGSLVVNEFAPRVHNTGHYTLDAAFISQFDQHIRAITDIGLGDTSLLSYGGMINILGLRLEDIPLDVIRYGKIYWYGKKEIKKRRKMGHINVIGTTINDVKTKLDIIYNLLYPKGPDL